MRTLIPSLIGVIHLPPLPGSPRFAGSLHEVAMQAAADARALAAAGFEGIILENFGDAPLPATTSASSSPCIASTRPRSASTTVTS